MQATQMAHAMLLVAIVMEMEAARPGFKKKVRTVVDTYLGQMVTLDGKPNPDYVVVRDYLMVILEDVAEKNQKGWLRRLFGL